MMVMSRVSAAIPNQAWRSRPLARTESKEPRRRTALVHKYVWGQSDAEGAHALRESLSTYRRLVARGLDDLRRLVPPASDLPER